MDGTVSELFETVHADKLDVVPSNKATSRSDLRFTIEQEFAALNVRKSPIHQARTLFACLYSTAWLVGCLLAEGAPFFDGRQVKFIEELFEISA
ncbi:hypothetical protein NDA00_29240 [Funiculus sociatus GB2-M2]|uniref:hypothetical protein n=1 Tax=Funiculus sociatus TaxID=450527 RepID=UPI003299B704